jgi:hypothetical protein
MVYSYTSVRLTVNRISKVIWITVAMALLLGCNTVSKPAPDSTIAPEIQLGKLAVISSPQEPEIKLEEFVGGKFAGATSAFGSTIGYCALVGLAADITSPTNSCTNLCFGLPPAVILLPIICTPYAAIYGSLVAMVSPSGAVMDSAKASFYKTMSEHDFREALRKQIVTTALANNKNVIHLTQKNLASASQSGDYRELQHEGVQMVLEVSLTKIVVEGNTSYRNPKPLRYRISTYVRLFRTADGDQIFSGKYDYTGEGSNMSEWLSNEHSGTVAALQNGLISLGDRINNSVFINTSQNTPSPKGQP